MQSPTHRSRCLSLALAAATALSGCSVIGVTRLDPEISKGEQPDCTSTWTLPLIDMGVAVASGSAGVLFHAAASQNDNDGDDPTTFRVAGWSAIGVALAFIASGVYGTVQRNRCRNAEVAYEKSAPPSWEVESGALKGGAGAACKTDEDCDEDLLCGQPMKTCIPANPPDETQTP